MEGTDIKTGRKSRLNELLHSLIIYLLLIFVALFFIIPLLWMLSTSLKDRSVLFTLKWFPLPLCWDNYITALKSIPFFLQLKNTVIIVVLNTVGQLLSSSLVAYGFARLSSPLKKPLFIVVLATMMIPGTLLTIPSYILFKTLGWIDTFLPLIVPAFFAHPFNIFLLKIFYQNIPMDYDEAAKIDGAGYFRIWWQLVMPMTKPVLITIAIFTFQNTWNDFFNPLIYLQSGEKFTLQLGLASFAGTYAIEWSSVMAAGIVIMVPCILFFIFAQKYFTQSLAFTGLKS